MFQRWLRCAVFPAALAVGGCGGDPAGTAPDETLASLTRCLTPESAERLLGRPDEVTGSGLLIYGYRISEGRTLWLSFPGQAPLVGATLEEPDGRRTPLSLRNC